jgi:outer membrane protein
MHNFVKLTLAACVLAFSTTGFSAGVKLGVVNVALLLEKAPQAKSATAALEKEFSPQQTELKNLAAKLEKEQSNYQKNRAAMSDSKKVLKEREITNLTRDIQRRRNDVQELLNLRRNEELAKLQNVVNEAIKSIGKKKDFDLILYEGIAYTNDRVDITQEVLKHLKTLSSKQRTEFNK